ncbi:AAA family ATPase [Pseudomonas aeruginosa]|uniref:AAA family ATPase n=1 Tax=Pseudomonas aeruginosa TaxID=287 RepID=UPI000E680572|nr:AAA family ATPase [Pseudomonas aeruginosa]MDI2218375.1 AAA family ATPase [Pseudomonas aeruginosa]
MEYSEEMENCPRAATPSIIQEFKIEGLHGYRNISLSSNYAATIIIAKNGSGKTTLLGALDAFLKGQFSRLFHLQFERITCRIQGIEEPLIINRHEIDRIYSPNTEESDISVYSKRLSIDPFTLIEFLESSTDEEPYDDEVFDKIRSAVGHNRLEARKLCERLRYSLYARSPQLHEILKRLKWALADIEIVYLPTYRRIELPLNLDGEDRKRYGYPRRRRNLQSRLGITKHSLHNADIQFGLSDISDRLSGLNQEILYSSNQGYREISANIINELIDGDFEKINPSEDQLPDREALSLFFSRIKDNRHISPYSDVSIPNMDKIYNNEIPYESNKFLTYFLSKLNSVVEATRGIELVVEEFISNCNRYLSAQDESTALHSSEDCEMSIPPSMDDKKLTLDRRTLKVNVESLITKRRLPLDSLSSGEKQMISLFARLYLYPKKKIFLIDEPELSLSLDWQSKILVDAMNAPSCVQIIAITHSPFVFDNALEPFAKAIDLEITTGKIDDYFIDEEDLSE